MFYSQPPDSNGSLVSKENKSTHDVVGLFAVIDCSVIRLVEFLTPQKELAAFTKAGWFWSKKTQKAPMANLVDSVWLKITTLESCNR